MTKLEFATSVAQIVGGEVKTVSKANGFSYNGILIHAESGVSPVINTDEMYDQGYDINKAVSTVSSLAESNMNTELLYNVTVWDQAKDHLQARLYHKDAFKKDVFTYSAYSYGFEDLVIVPFLVDLIEGENASCKVTAEMISKWDVAPLTVFNQAMKNVADDYTIRPLFDVLKDMIDIPFPEPDPTVDCLFIVTNKSGNFGAISIIPALEELRERFGEFYVLPSSLHEVLVVPKSFHDVSSELTTMVQEVNDTQVHQTEILSDHVYEF